MNLNVHHGGNYAIAMRLITSVNVFHEFALLAIAHINRTTPQHTRPHSLFPSCGNAEYIVYIEKATAGRKIVRRLSMCFTNCKAVCLADAALKYSTHTFSRSEPERSIPIYICIYRHTHFEISVQFVCGRGRWKFDVPVDVFQNANC